MLTEGYKKRESSKTESYKNKVRTLDPPDNAAL